MPTIPRPEFRELLHRCADAQRVLLVAHQKPDGDTLGSSSAVLNWLSREKKDVTAFCKDPVPQAFRHLDRAYRYTTDPTVFSGMYDLVIVFDSGDLRYCGVEDFFPQLRPGYFLVNLDHHATNTNFADLNIVMTTASSTAEVVYRFFEACGVEIDPLMATSLLNGLLTDTSHFTNGATTVKALEAAGSLVALGARMDHITQAVMRNKATPALKLWGLMLSRLHLDAKRGIATTYLRHSDAEGVPSEAVEGLSNFLSATLADADAMLTLRETPDGLIKGSLRSATRDISRLAQALGGGGHKKASGFAIAGRIQETPDGPRIVPV
jgi:phosphoesterase RecJ-like protein